MIRQWQGSMPRYFSLLFVMLLCLVGFALRIYELDGQSMWSDEGLSHYRSQLPASEILSNTIVVDGVPTTDTNPPLYFLLLHWFGMLSGFTVFNLRFIGAAAATLAVPLLYVIALKTHGRSTALFAAFLMAISPFHIWQSQVLRNYGLFLTLCLLSVYGLFRYVLGSGRSARLLWFVLWLVAGLLTIYTHYFGFLVFAYALLVLVAPAVRRPQMWISMRSRNLWIALGIIVVLAIPALVVAAGRFLSSQQIDFYRMPVGAILEHSAGAFVVGVSPTLTHPAWRVLPFVFIALLGIFASWRGSRKATLLLVGYQIVPLALLMALSTINPLYNGVRHLLVGLPPFLIFLAAGVAGPQNARSGAGILPSWHKGWLALGALLAILLTLNQTAWLKEQFTSPDLVRDDVRGAAQFLTRHSREDDIIVLHDTLIKFTFDAYYSGVAPVRTAVPFDSYDAETAIAALQKSAEGRSRVWFLTQPTPRTGFDRSALITWADHYWLSFYQKQFPSLWLFVALKGYATDVEVTAVPSSVDTTSAVWDGLLQLHGFNVPAQITAGEDWWAEFYLTQIATEAQQHTILLRLIDENGQERAKMGRPIARGYPPSAPAPGGMVRYEHYVNTPAGIPAGKYQLWLSLLETVSGDPVPLSSGETNVYLTDVMVEPASCKAAAGALDDLTVQRANFGSGLDLVASHVPPAGGRPGHLLPVELLWCFTEQPSSDYQVRLQIVAQNGNVLFEEGHVLAPGSFVPSSEDGTLLLRETTGIAIPAAATESRHYLRLSVLESDGGRALRAGWFLGPRSVELGPFEITPWPFVAEPPPVSSPISAEFGIPPIGELAGYDLLVEGEPLRAQITPGESLTLNLLWRASAGDMTDSYLVFVHLTGAEGNILAQDDGVPALGFRPTTSWREGEYIVDEHVLTIPAQAEPGEYRLFVGLYDPDTFNRAPVLLQSTPQPDQRLGLQIVNVAGMQDAQ